MLDMMGGVLGSAAGLALLMVALPAFCGLLLWLLKKSYAAQVAVALISSLLNLIFALALYARGEFTANIPFSPLGAEFTFRSYGLSMPFIAAAALIFVPLSLYAVSSLKGHEGGGLFLMLEYIGAGMLNGAFLAGNLGFTLFFGEGLLCIVFGILLIGNREKPGTAVKALVTAGFADLVLMFGIIVTSHLSEISEIAGTGKIPLEGEGLLGFACVVIGAFGISGCIPFHSWIPDASADSPAAFSAAFTGTFQPLLGAFIAARAVSEVYDFGRGGVSAVFTVFGIAVFVAAAAAAFVQTDLKRLTAYAAIGQAGYAAAVISSGSASGVAGGIFAALSAAVCVSGLFMVAGTVSGRCGTSELGRLGGLAKRMPAEAAGFTVLSLSAVGFPGSAGFFSNAFASGALLGSGAVFCVCAAAGTFLTAMALAKAGYSVFLGSSKAQDKPVGTNGSGSASVLPCLLAAVCVAAGALNGPLYRSLIAPSVDSSAAGDVTAALIVAAAGLAGAALWMFALRKSGKTAARAETHDKYPYLDPYDLLVAAVGGFSRACTAVEHGVSWFYDKGVPGLVKASGSALHRFDNGRLSRYLYLAVGGVVVIMIIFVIVK